MGTTIKYTKSSSILFAALLLTGSTGCDQISALFGKKETAVVPAAQTSSAPIVAPVAADGPLPANVVARVGKWSVTIDEFNDRMTKLKEILPEFDPSNANSKRLILEEMIRQELLVMDAEASGLAQQKDIVATVEDFRKTLLVQEIATALTKDIEADALEAQKYYDDNKDRFIINPEWKLREIVVPTESEANEILVQILQGADFAETAKARSKSSTAAKGGDLGFVKDFPFEQMRGAVNPLEKGKVSSVFKGPEGFYLVKLEEKKGGDPQPFTAVKDELIKGLTLRKQQQAVLEHLNKLASKADIKVNEELLK